VVYVLSYNTHESLLDRLISFKIHLALTVQPPATNRPPRTTAHAIETVGRVQTTLPAVMQSLEPRFGGVSRGQAGVAVPHQATRGPLVVPSNATPRPALVAATARQAMLVQTMCSNPLPLVRSSKTNLLWVPYWAKFKSSTIQWG
jgi:hypothetical protein